MVASILLLFLGMVDTVLAIYVAIIVIWTLTSLLDSLSLVPWHYALVSRAGHILYRLALPPIHWVRRWLPPLGVLDLSPLAVLFGLYVARIILQALMKQVAIHF